jgi:hypothetical protein
MAGRTPEQAATMAGMLFSLCSNAQRLAAQIACAAAENSDPKPDAKPRLAVLLEWMREHAWRLLLNWPAVAGQSPDPLSLKALRDPGADAEQLAELVEVLLQKLLDEPAQQWLARDWDGLQRWLAAGSHAAKLFDKPYEGQEPDVCASGFLPELHAMTDEDVGDLARSALNDGDFCARPTWRGAPVETGILPRVIRHPLISEWTTRRGAGADARLLARLVEFAVMPARLGERDTALARAWRLGDGTGVAGVETSRGVLFHIARLGNGKVQDYRIVSPTEWNFHPDGPLVEAMRRLPCDEGLEARAQRLSLAFDPCVDYGVEIAHA